MVWSQPQLQATAPGSAPRPEPAPAVAEAAPKPELAAAEAGPKPESAPVAAEAGPLLSDQADQAVSAAFDALSTTLALQSSELAENVAREILRPLLKTWLDENLPSMVERLVRAEIQRVARGGR